MKRGCLAAVVIAALVSGCAATLDPIQVNAPLKLAFAEPVESLEARAAANDRQAQYALSFLKKHGLRGVARDPVGAETLRASAGVPVSRVMPIYQPGVNGGAGTIINVPIADPGINDALAARLDLCGMTVLTVMPALGGQLCGSPAAYADLLPVAVPARESLLLRATEVDPAKVERCEGVGPLWNAAAARFETGALDQAAANADRIIDLCGEGEASWHARVMRSVLAAHAGDGDKAMALLAPVPRPAPAPIGGYAGFAAMAAQAVREDWPAYAQERDRLLDASEAALRAEKDARFLGRIERDGVTIDLFERRSPIHDNLTGLVVGLVRDPDQKAAPRAFWLTTSPDPLGGSAPAYFLDEYRCDGRSAFVYFDRGSERPSLEALQGMMLEILAGERQAVSGSSYNGPPNACRFPILVAPGLGDDPLSGAGEPLQDSVASVSSTSLP